MTWQSLLVPFTLFLIVLVVVLIFIPAYLERLSRVNRAKEAQYRKRQKELEREERRIERLLTPYRRARSDMYRSAVVQVDKRLAHIRDELAQIEQLIEALQCPQLFDYLFPIQHFAIAPGHIRSIVTDARTLQHIKSQLKVIDGELANANESFDRLADLPTRLHHQRDVLLKRLESLQVVIVRERDESIEALDDFTRDVATIERLMSQAEPVSPALTEIDAAALALQQVEATLVEAELRMTELERERIALDRRVRRAATELDNAQASTKSGSGTEAVPQVRPILRQAAALLNESAQDHRKRREFNAAGADVTSAVQLITFSRDLLSAHRQIQLLVEREDGTTLAEPIAVLKKEMTDLLERMDGDGIRDHSALSGAAIAGQAARVRTRSDTLLRRQDALIAELQLKATRTKEQLDRSWMVGQNLIRLSPDDPLARRYVNLSMKFEEITQRPTELEMYRSEVAAFEGVWGTWVVRVQATHARIIRIREALPSQIDQSLTLAEPWACLTEDLKFIQQRAADFEILRSHFGDSHYRREAESIMDQLEAVESDIVDRLDRLKERADRLAFLESDVSQILKLVPGGDGEMSIDAPERPRWERVSMLIDHHIRSAHVAMHYEDASVALLRAAEAANKLAL